MRLMGILKSDIQFLFIVFDLCRIILWWIRTTPRHYSSSRSASHSKDRSAPSWGIFCPVRQSNTLQMSCEQSVSFPKNGKIASIIFYSSARSSWKEGGGVNIFKIVWVTSFCGFKIGFGQKLHSVCSISSNLVDIKAYRTFIEKNSVRQNLVSLLAANLFHFKI